MSEEMPKPASSEEPQFTQEHLNSQEFQESELGVQYDKAEAIAPKANEHLDRAVQGQAERDRIDADRAEGIDTGPYPGNTMAGKMNGAKKSFEKTVDRAENTMPSREELTKFAKTIESGVIIDGTLYEAVEDEVVIDGKVYKKVVLGDHIAGKDHSKRMKQANSGNGHMRAPGEQKTNYDRTLDRGTSSLPKEITFDDAHKNDGRAVKPKEGTY